MAEALLGACDDLNTKVPEGIIDALRAQAMNRDIERNFANSDNLSRFWMDLKASKGLAQWVRLIGTRALPPRSHLVEKYPEHQNSPTFILRGRMLADTASRVIRKVTSG